MFPCVLYLYCIENLSTQLKCASSTDTRTLAAIPGHFLILAYTNTRSPPFSLTQDFALANGVSLEQAAIKVRSKQTFMHTLKEYHPLSIIARARCLAAWLAFSLFLSPLPSLSDILVFFLSHTPSISTPKDD